MNSKREKGAQREKKELLEQHAEISRINRRQYALDVALDLNKLKEKFELEEVFADAEKIVKFVERK